jgi:hypothetical protein
VEVVDVHAVDADPLVFRTLEVQLAQALDEVAELDIAPHPSREAGRAGHRLLRGAVGAEAADIAIDPCGRRPIAFDGDRVEAALANQPLRNAAALAIIFVRAMGRFAEQHPARIGGGGDHLVIVGGAAGHPPGRRGDRRRSGRRSGGSGGRRRRRIGRGRRLAPAAAAAAGGEAEEERERCDPEAGRGEPWTSIRKAESCPALMLEAEQPSRRFRRVAVDPVEIGGGEFVMRLDGAAMFRRAGELDLRLGPAFIIFAFFLRHLAGISALFRNRIKTVRPPPTFPGIALIQVVDPDVYESEGGCRCARWFHGLEPRPSLTISPAMKHYTVTARARASALFPLGQALAMDYDLAGQHLHLEMTTRRKGQNSGFVGDLQVTAQVQADSVEDAAAFVTRGREMAAMVSLATNAAIAPLEAELVYETTPGVEEREFFQRFVPEDELSYADRLVPMDATAALLSSVAKHEDREPADPRNQPIR